MREELTTFQKNKIFRQFNELVLQQKKATDALDSLRINKGEMLTQMTLNDYSLSKENAMWLHQAATERLEKGLFSFIRLHPELEEEVIPYFTTQHSTVH